MGRYTADNPIPPQELLAQLDEEVALLIATPSVQEDWATTTRFPAEEIALQFYDAVPMWFSRLRETGMIDSADEAALNGLNAYLLEHQTKLFLDGPRVTAAPEWATVRRLATAALVSLRRPLDEKTN